jgi:hypothetical protein
VWPTHFACIEIRAERFDVLVELLFIQDLIQPLIKRRKFDRDGHFLKTWGA